MIHSLSQNCRRPITCYIQNILLNNLYIEDVQLMKKGDKNATGFIDDATKINSLCSLCKVRKPSKCNENFIENMKEGNKIRLCFLKLFFCTIAIM